ARDIGGTTDVQRTLTLASIIEKQTAVPDERPLLASVYYNRLSKNTALQADPSVNYPELLQGAYGGTLHHADLRFPSSYNTYTHAGLPPGPIGNPEKGSLEADQHPSTNAPLHFGHH